MDTIHRIELIPNEIKKPAPADLAERKGGPINITNIVHNDKGTEMYLEGFLFPYKGWPEEKKVEILKVTKKSIKVMLQYLTIKPLVIPIGIMLFFFRKHIKTLKDVMMNCVLDIMFPALKGYLIDPKKYCPFVREIYRIISLGIERESSPQLKRTLTRLRDVICFGLEYDSAYRYRLQDMLMNLDLSQVKLDEGDKYFVLFRNDYDFFGRNFGSRKQELEQIHDDWYEGQKKEEREREKKVKPFNEELNKLLNEYGVTLDVFTSYQEKDMRPWLRIRFTDKDKQFSGQNPPTEKDEEIKSEIRKISGEFDKKFQELCKKYDIIPQTYFTPPPGPIVPQLRFAVKNEEEKEDKLKVGK